MASLTADGNRGVTNRYVAVKGEKTKKKKPELHATLVADENKSALQSPAFSFITAPRWGKHAPPCLWQVFFLSTCRFFIIDKTKSSVHELTLRQRESINKRKTVSLDSNMIFYHKQKQQSNPEGLLLEPF